MNRPVEQKKPESSIASTIGAFLGIIVVLLLCYIIFVRWWWIVLLEGMLLYVFESSVHVNLVDFLLCMIPIILLGKFCISECIAISNSTSAYDKYLKDLEEYKELVDKVEASNKQRACLIEKEVQTRIDNACKDIQIENEKANISYITFCEERDQYISELNKQKTSILSSREKVSSILNVMYEQNIIYPKYRGIVAVTTICEYLESNRCDTLDGAFGAYNIYESELRANIIIAKLDRIINSLDKIRENQYKLYDSIQEAHMDSQRIATSIIHELDETHKKQVEMFRDCIDMQHRQEMLANQYISEVKQNQALLEYNNQVAERIHNIQETEFWVR